MPLYLFAAVITAISIYAKIKKYFDKKLLNVKWKVFLTTKFGIWIDNPAQTKICSGRTVEKSKILLHIEKTTESNDGEITFHV